ncbi:helix-turn-helix transcriptional regulator [Paenibacillus alba]|nr:helix-turn-helix transcriptional regulator [Paenibacillus alba]
MKCGAIMQACRERAGLTQEQLAEKLNLSRISVINYEKDKRIPNAPTLMNWVAATGSQEVAVAFFCGMDGLSIMQSILGLVGS